MAVDSSPLDTTGTTNIIAQACFILDTIQERETPVVGRVQDGLGLNVETNIEEQTTTYTLTVSHEMTAASNGFTLTPKNFLAGL